MSAATGADASIAPSTGAVVGSVRLWLRLEGLAVAAVGAYLYADYETGNVWALFVDPRHEGRGYGRRLHDTMVTWLWERGHQRLCLTTEPGTRAERHAFGDDVVDIALTAIRRNRLQTLLTMIGISMGVATVLAMMAVERRD